MIRGLLLATVVLLTISLAHAADPEPTLMRVLVGEKLHSPVVEVTGRYRVINPQTSRSISWGLFGKSYPAQALETGIRWGEEFLGLYQLAISPSDSRSSVLVNGVQYRGSIVLYQVGDAFNVINEVPIDYYCKVILSPQFQKPLAPEVMSAIAILTRTHACWQARRHEGALYDVRADEVGYRGHAVTLTAPDIIRAVDDTRYMVLERQGLPGESFPAVWTEDCAGTTAPYDIVFRVSGVEGRGVEAPLAAHHRSESAWQVAVPVQWLAKAAQLKDIERVSLYSDADSHKVYALRLGAGSESADMDFAALQQVVGSDRLLSNDFTAEVQGNEILFRGYGRGLGVGLCLYSAEKMAARGQNAADILEAFYPDASLRIFEPERKKLPLIARFFPGLGESRRAGAKW
jgi:stage II sporulation protein D